MNKIIDHRSPQYQPVQGKQITEERDVVTRILRGERQAFERFYAAHKQALWKFALSKISREEDAEEMVQDIFLAFLDSLPLFSFRSNLKTFLYSIARHEVADYFRRKYAKRVLRVVPILGEHVAEELYTTGELSQKIDYVYARLLPEYARILVMKYEEGLSIKKIAEKLKVTVKAAESKLWRARQAFQMAYAILENDE